MRLLAINMLYLLWVIPVFIGLLAYAAWRRKQALLGFADSSLLQHINNTVHASRRRWKAVLLVAAFAFAVAALARPAWNPVEQEVERRVHDAGDRPFCDPAQHCQPTKLQTTSSSKVLMRFGQVRWLAVDGPRQWASKENYQTDTDREEQQVEGSRQRRKHPLVNQGPVIAKDECAGECVRDDGYHTHGEHGQATGETNPPFLAGGDCLCATVPRDLQ